MNQDYAQAHALRYKRSIEWLTLVMAKVRSVLELGGESPFTEIFKAAFPYADLFTAPVSDLRYSLVFTPKFDLVLCQEVIEHLGDPDPDQGTGFHTGWVGTGAQTLLETCRDALNPGGLLFLTTPNPCSITAIHHALGLAPPMMWRQHVREYAPYELDEMIRQAGFEIIRRETLDVWRNAIGAREYKRIADFIQQAGYSTDLRGEDYFVLANRK